MGEILKEEKKMRNTRWRSKVIPSPRQEREYIKKDEDRNKNESNEKEKKELTYENIFNILADFQSDILKLLPTNIPEKDEKNKPRYYTYRLYVYDAKRGDTYMLFKYIYDTAKPDGDWKIYYNNEIFSKTSENMQRVLKNAGYLPTEDIVY